MSMKSSRNPFFRLRCLVEVKINRSVQFKTLKPCSHHHLRLAKIRLWGQMIQPILILHDSKFLITFKIRKKILIKHRMGSLSEILTFFQRSKKLLIFKSRLLALQIQIRLKISEMSTISISTCNSLQLKQHRQQWPCLNKTTMISWTTIRSSSSALQTQS